MPSPTTSTSGLRAVPARLAAACLALAWVLLACARPAAGAESAPGLADAGPAPATAQLLEAIDALEERLDHATRVSGYADVELRASDLAGTRPGVRLHHLSLFVTKRMPERWRFFSEIEYEDAPFYEAAGPADIEAAQGTVFVEAVHLDFAWRPEASFRFGRFFTPAGIWSVNHYPPFVATQERPLHIRRIFPQVVDGADAYGLVATRAGFLRWDLYAGNGEGNPGSGDLNAQKAVGLRLSLEPHGAEASAGVTAYRDTLDDGTAKTALGAHASLRAGRLALQGEWAAATLKAPGGAVRGDAGGYLQAGYHVEPCDAGYRFDLLEQGGMHRRDTVFAHHHVSPGLVVKAEVHFDRFEGSAREDGTTGILSLGVYLE